MSAESIAVPVPPDEALQRLVLGNERFCRGEAHWSGTRPDSLAALAAGQRPFATILGCSDSRVPPELVFDTGLGDSVRRESRRERVLQRGCRKHPVRWRAPAHAPLRRARPRRLRRGRGCSRDDDPRNAPPVTDSHPGGKHPPGARQPSTGGCRHPRSWPWRWSATCGGRCGRSPSRRKDGHALQRGKSRWSGACTRWPRGGCGCLRTRSRRGLRAKD